MKEVWNDGIMEGNDKGKNPNVKSMSKKE